MVKFGRYLALAVKINKFSQNLLENEVISKAIIRGTIK